jgi:hypothetical protein
MFAMLAIRAIALFMSGRITFVWFSVCFLFGLLLEGSGRRRLMLMGPGETFLSGKAAAVGPAILRGHAAAMAGLAGKRLRCVLGGGRRQGKTAQRRDLADESQPEAQAPSRGSQKCSQPSAHVVVHALQRLAPPHPSYAAWRSVASAGNFAANAKPQAALEIND